MKEDYKKYLIYAVYSLIVVLVFGFLVWLGHYSSFVDFVNKIEQSTFDLRQVAISKHKHPNKSLIIISVDDATYEYIMDKYGSWPIPRRVWASAIEGLEQAQPKYLIFDMLFLKPDLKDALGDAYFVNTVRNNKNVYLSMNFDNYTDDIRKASQLDSRLKLKVKEGVLYDGPYISFINSRPVMKQLSDACENIGIINVIRDSDGLIRNAIPVFKYKGDYYPNLSLKVALDMLDIDSVSFKDNNIIIDKNHIIPLDESKRTILNWYGKSTTFKHIPFWQVLKAQKEGDIDFLKKEFKNKVVYIGTTATSLSDIKSVPTDSNMAGVELHTTFLNNILDNNFIKKASIKMDFLISIILSLLVGYFVLKTTSVLKSFAFLFVILGLYTIITTYLMLFFNLWIALVIPYIATFATFIFVYCEKYLLKLKDYEQTYKLAVTDGLTQMYNHRYFQEQMIINTNNYNRYGTVFSLILIDIDFFKKFNDTYGHQSGDCVLVQVANIIKKNSRTSDIACRYGGEEMAVILTNTALNDASIMANKICEAIRNNKFTLANGEKVNVTISVGVAQVALNKKPQQIIEQADKCLYKAKETGRDKVVFEL